MDNYCSLESEFLTLLPVTNQFTPRYVFTSFFFLLNLYFLSLQAFWTKWSSNHLTSLLQNWKYFFTNCQWAVSENHMKNHQTHNPQSTTHILCSVGFVASLICENMIEQKTFLGWKDTPWAQRWCWTVSLNLFSFRVWLSQILCFLVKTCPKGFTPILWIFQNVIF